MIPPAFSSYGYGYGAAGIPLPRPVVTGQALIDRSWIIHPVFIGLMLSLLVIWLARSWVMPVTRPHDTVLWLSRTPEAPEPVVVQQPSPQVTTQTKEEAIEPSPPPPELMTRKVVRERPAPVKKPDPIPVPDRSVSPDIRKRVESVEREVVRPEMKTAPAPSAVPEAVRRQQERPDTRTVYRQAEAPAMVPEQAAARPTQSRSEAPSRPRSERVAAVDFKPLPSASAEKTVQSAVSESRRPSSTRIAAGQRTVAMDDGGAVSRPVAAAGQQTERSGRGQAVSSGRQFSPDLPAVNTPSTPSGGRATDADRVTITGLVTGESSRIQNLKRMIFQKARGLKPGAYCSRIQDVQCRLLVTADENISITFSRDAISFDIVSRLERRLPEGVQPCAD